MNDRDIEDTRQPKDLPEAVYCDECGEEMEEDKWGDWMKHYMKCVNPFCPRLFDSVSKEMAELIVEQKDLIKLLEGRVKFLATRREWKVKNGKSN
jgi:hypothetical protein